MIRFVEFFSGIGAFHQAALGIAEVVGAFDQDSVANEVYEFNHGLRPSARNLQSIKPAEISRFDAEGWFLSPPCQPYTQKGAGRDVDDPRAKPLLHFIDLIPVLRPRFILLENVPPFADSRSRALLSTALTLADMHCTEVLLCPTMLGIPNRRLRYFLLASRDAEPEVESPAPVSSAGTARSLPLYLDSAADDGLYLPDGFHTTYGPGLDVVEGSGGITACFGSSYGKARARAGSYLLDEKGLRRFSPGEIARLLAFKKGFIFPEGFDTLTRYRLLGNSVNVACLRRLLRSLLP